MGLPFFLNICTTLGGIPENKDSKLGMLGYFFYSGAAGWELKYCVSISGIKFV